MTFRNLSTTEVTRWVERNPEWLCLTPSLPFFGVRFLEHRALGLSANDGHILLELLWLAFVISGLIARKTCVFVLAMAVMAIGIAWLAHEIFMGFGATHLKAAFILFEAICLVRLYSGFSAARRAPG